MWVKMAEVIPEGSRGCASIHHQTVSVEQSKRTVLRAMFNPDAYVPPGTYAQLRINGQLMMSDTSMEKESNCDAVLRAKGHVLVAGLGIGMIIPPMLARDSVSKLTIVEKHADVIELVESPLRAYLGKKKAKRLEVVQGDIFDWTPAKGIKYDALYFDIWPVLTEDTLKEMETLHRRFARRKTKGAWMDSWKRQWLKRKVRRGR